MFRNLSAVCLAFMLAAACAPKGQDSFVKEEQTLTLTNNFLTGTARTDLWALATITIAGSPTETVVHTRDGTRWDPLSLPELPLNGGRLFADSMVSSGKGEIWLSMTTPSANVASLFKVSLSGGVEDHSSELPMGAAHVAPHLTFAAGTLFVVQAIATGPAVPPFGEPHVSRVYRRVGSALEEVPGLPTGLDFTVLAAKGPDDLFLLHNPGLTGESKVLHSISGVANEVAWDIRADGTPIIEFSASGETWLWKANGDTQVTLAGQYGPASVLTAWTTQGWPVSSNEKQVTQRAFGIIPLGAGKLAALVTRTDAKAMKESERVTVGVNYLDPQGKVIEGARLFSCLVPQDCAVGLGSVRVFPDGTVIIPGNEGKIWIRGSTSDLQ